MLTLLLSQSFVGGSRINKLALPNRTTGEHYEMRWRAAESQGTICLENDGSLVGHAQPRTVVASALQQLDTSFCGRAARMVRIRDEVQRESQLQVG